MEIDETEEISLDWTPPPSPEKPSRDALPFFIPFSYDRSLNATYPSPHQALPPLKSVSGEAGVSISWGEKTETTAYVQGSASDDHGSSARVRAEVHEDGSGSASASIHHDRKTS